jgi:hypothetical protein
MNSELVKSVKFAEKKAIGEKGKKINIVIGNEKKRIYHHLFDLEEALTIEEAEELLEEIKMDLMEIPDNLNTPESPVYPDGSPRYSYQAVFHFQFQGWKSGNVVNLNPQTKLVDFAEDYAFEFDNSESNFDAPQTTDKVTKIMINLYPFDEKYSSVQ